MNKYIIPYISLLSLSLWLSACTMPQELVRPMPDVPEQYRMGAVELDSVSIAQLDWRTFFQDAPLIHLIERALTHNTDLLLAIQNMEMAQLQLQRARWGNSPVLDFSMQATTEHASDNNLERIPNRSHVEDFKMDLGLHWEADIWGKIKNKKKVALVRYLQSEEAKKGVQTLLIADIAQGYYNLMLLDDELLLATQNLVLSDNTTELIRLQFQAGQNTALALEQAEAQGLYAAQLLPSLQQKILLQEHALSILVGSFPRDIGRAPSLDSIGIQLAIHTGVPAAMLALRPDVKRAELDLTAANAEVGIAQAAFYPSLTISYSAGLQSFQLSNWLTMPASLFGLLGAGISQPLLQRRTIKTNYALAMAAREKSVIHFRATVLKAVGEVSDALVDIAQQRKQQDILSEQLLLLEASVHKARSLFQSGKANYLEILMAQRNQLNSALDLRVSKRNELFARVELYRALGGGWQ